MENFPAKEYMMRFYTLILKESDGSSNDKNAVNIITLEMEVSQPQTVHIVRGPSGCGKTTFAKELRADIIAEETSLFPNAPYITPQLLSTDDFFTTKDGEYKFDPRMLSRAHTETISNAMSALKMGRDVIIANTFTNYWEVSPYLWMAQLAGASCIVYEPDFMDAINGSHRFWVTEDGRHELENKLFDRCTHGVPYETIENHVLNFHHLEESKLVSKVKQFNTGLL